MTIDILLRSAIVLATALALASPIGAQSAHELFQQALSKERAEGNLPEAIKLYQRVVDTASTDHALAAKTLLQLGRCYEQLGNTQARSAYERLIARYPDQADLVTQAKSRLAALAPTPPSGRASTTVRPLPDLNNGGELLTVSTDGTKAIVMDYSKGQNIALYDLAKKQKRLLTHLDWTKAWIYYAAWSPDARRVAYQRASLPNKVSSPDSAFELRATALDGRSSVVYRSESYVQPVGWTPDGRTIVVLVARPDRTWAVGTVPASGGRFTPVRSFGWSDANPRLSPDGRFIAYEDGEQGTRDVHVVSLDGRTAYRVTDDPADDRSPIWSPDSRYLAFTSTRLGSLSLWAVDVKDGKPVRQPVKLKDGMQSAGLIDWTVRGIFYDQRTDAWDIYTMPMDPVERRPAGSPQQLLYWRTGRNVSPVWSPDGGRLAFVSSSASERNRRYVVVMPGSGGTPREFPIPTTAWQYSQSPYDLRWFGDGRGLGFSGHDTRNAPAVFRLTLDTGEWDTIPLPGEQYRTAIEWNRDGSAFYFARTGAANPGIFERAIDVDTERAVYRSTAPLLNLTRLEFSPDRKWLAFQQWTAGADNTITKRIPIVDVATVETRTVLENTRGVNDGSAPDLVGWAPSGDLLIHRRGTGGAASESVAMPVNGGTARPITIPSFAPGPGGTQPNLVAKWSPDGRMMVLGRVSRGGETFVIENPLAAVRAMTTSRR
jgi:Tol biopolymer transport system component